MPINRKVEAVGHMRTVVYAKMQMMAVASKPEDMSMFAAPLNVLTGGLVKVPFDGELVVAGAVELIVVGTTVEELLPEGELEE